MKVVINTCYGGFDIPEELHDHFYDDSGYEIPDANPRTDKVLIDFIETHGDDDNFYVFGYSSLRVVEIPDNATDWIITDYDGLETIYYVVDGKIYSY